MNNVDYQKLSEQYASFLVAVGGVSITVLTLVLSLGSDSGKTPPVSVPSPVSVRSFLVGALMVATVACFVGAHMMAETASFIRLREDRDPPTGKRLFLIASINIFIGITLFVFAGMLLPTSSGNVDPASLTPISLGVFVLIVLSTVYWMILAAQQRMAVPNSKRAIVVPPIVALGFVVGLFFCPIPKYWLLLMAFTPSALTTFGSLIVFAWIFSKSETDNLRNARPRDVLLFSLAIAISYTTLVVAGLKIMLGNEFADGS